MASWQHVALGLLLLSAFAYAAPAPPSGPKLLGQTMTGALASLGNAIFGRTIPRALIEPRDLLRREFEEKMMEEEEKKTINVEEPEEKEEVDAKEILTELRNFIDEKLEKELEMEMNPRGCPNCPDCPSCPQRN